MAPRRLNVAVAGLGRMGARHATHFLERTPRANLVAAFCPADAPNEIAWAREHLEPYGVKLYHDYDAMLRHHGLEAVVIATVTTVHAEQAIKAINANKHVLCEKPLSTSVEVVCLVSLTRANS
jgi:myo-inositol 2-dehydrogenase / D-chiro-inositol 1-dehydrogenase